MIEAQRIAVVGAGISGLAAAWLLAQKHEVTVFEAAPRPGGHANTFELMLGGVTHPVDTGFLVYNPHACPQLAALFAHLGVRSVEAHMSFSVSLGDGATEWSGSSLAALLGRKRNLLRADFWRMLADGVRFARESEAAPGQARDGAPLREFLRAGGYSRAFTEWYLLPMAEAILCCPGSQALDCPTDTFFRLWRNYGQVRLFDRRPWRTVEGGASAYVNGLAARLADLRLQTPVRRIDREDEGLRIVTDHGALAFDQVVLACHSDEARALLAQGATPEEDALLSGIRYARSRALLHTDAALLPRERRLWAAWNCRYGAGAGRACDPAVSVSYLLNLLQPLPFSAPVIVTRNPQQEPSPDRVVAEFAYVHPIIDAAAINTQNRLSRIVGRDGLWWCGAWSGDGFHEDGLNSALRVAAALGCAAPWAGAPGADAMARGAASPVWYG